MKNGVDFNDVGAIETNMIECKINIIKAVDLTDCQFAKVMNAIQGWGSLKFVLNQKHFLYGVSNDITSLTIVISSHIQAGRHILVKTDLVHDDFIRWVPNALFAGS